MARYLRHTLCIAALLALYGCAYTPKEAHYLPTHPDFEMRPTVLQKGTVFMRATNPVNLQAGQSVVGGTPRGSVPRAAVPTDPTQWVDIKDVRVVLHADDRTMEELFNDLLVQVRPYTGPWQVQWRLKKDNLDILDEPFSLNTETTFGELVNYMADFMVNYRGIRLKFEMFNAERILVITDNG
jgi:hypothetical protein